MNVSTEESNRPDRKGFTLLEILLAMATSAIVLSVITTVYFSALQLRNRTMESYDEVLPLQHTIMVLKRDLAEVMPPGGTLSGEIQTEPSDDQAVTSMNLLLGGRQVGPLLYTASGSIDEYTPFADVRRVAYFLVNPTNNVSPGFDLIRVSSGNLLPSTTDQPTSRWLMGGIESMGFQFYDGTSWINTWDSETSGTAPAAIKVQIVPAARDNGPNLYIREPLEIIVPLLMQARPEQGNGSSQGGES